jgi:hypothetical protein
MIRLRSDIAVLVTEFCRCGKHPRSIFTWQIVAAWKKGLGT